MKTTNPRRVVGLVLGLGLLALTSTGCASGTRFRFGNLMPSLGKPACEWVGIMASGVEFHPEHQKWCFRTKRSENAPGAVLACSGDPAIIAEMRAIPYSQGWPVRFTCDPRGSDQETAIGEELRARLVGEASKLSTPATATEKATGSDLSCADALLDVRDAFAMILDRTKDQEVRPIAQAGTDLVRQYIAKATDQEPKVTVAPSPPNAVELLALVEGAPPTGYLEVLKVWTAEVPR